MEVTKITRYFPLRGNKIPWYIKKQRESLNIPPFRGKKHIFHYLSIVFYFMEVIQIVTFFPLGANKMH